MRTCAARCSTGFATFQNKIGLTNYLTTEMPLEDVIVPTSVENLSLLPSGMLPADAVGILNSQRMSDLIARIERPLRHRFLRFSADAGRE